MDRYIWFPEDLDPMFYEGELYEVIAKGLDFFADLYWGGGSVKSVTPKNSRTWLLEFVTYTVDTCHVQIHKLRKLDERV